MKQSNVFKPKKIALEKHNGCRDCSKVCLFNVPCTTQTKNSQSSDLKYGCNSSK